jgi:hypothetical protein
MNQDPSNGASAAGKFMYVTFSLYILFYVLFIGDDSFLINMHFVCVAVMKLINKLFLHRVFPGFVWTADSYWAYVASLTFFSFAILGSIAWLVFLKQKRFPLLFDLVFVIARYFVAFELLFYGIEKLDGVQFHVQADRLLPSVGSSDPFNLFWISTGSSMSYSFFGGLLETVSALLLFFRRTTTLGCLIAIPLLLNVLLINIGFDINIKLKSFHLLIFCFYLLTPDLKNLFNFLILRQNASLSAPPLIWVKGKPAYWTRHAVKFLVIGFFFFRIVNGEIDYSNNFRHSPHQRLFGIFNVKDFQLVRRPNVLGDSSIKWKKLAISPGNGIQVQLINDSIADFDYRVDMQHRIIELTSWADNTHKATLHFKESESNEWVFGGTYNTDSIRFSSTKIDLDSLPLLKGRGKIKWTY